MQRIRGLLLPLAGGLLALACADAPVMPAAKAKVQFTTIPGRVPGPEDLVFDPAFGRLLVSSHDRLNQAHQGAIYAIDLKERKAKELSLDFGNLCDTIVPHGIAILGTRLFVINHAHKAESIDVFDIGRDELTLRERIRGPAIQHPNDLDVRGTKEGYELWFSNPARDRGLLWEAFIGPHSSYVAHLRSGDKNVTRHQGFRYANGVASDAAGNVWVASSIDQKLLRLNDLTDDIELDSVGDNITREGKTLLVAAGGSSVKLYKHLKAGIDGERELPLSPTRIWRVTPGERPATELLFADDGTNISGGSAAVCVDGDLFIGSVFNDFVAEVKGAC